MIHDYHIFSRSIRTGDLEMFIAILLVITNYFFSLNHPNYARWSVKYHDNLVKLQETHEDVYNDFRKGWFGIKKNIKTFFLHPH